MCSSHHLLFYEHQKVGFVHSVSEAFIISKFNIRSLRCLIAKVLPEPNPMVKYKLLFLLKLNNK
jgi:hypothetical protein